jgi:hypothetical protein
MTGHPRYVVASQLVKCEVGNKFQARASAVVRKQVDFALRVSEATDGVGVSELERQPLVERR